MRAPYTSLAIANTFVRLFGDKEGIEHMKLQKLMYFAYGWWLAEKGINGVRLTHEKPRFWQHGPVCHDLYYVLKVFGRKPIFEMQSMSPFRSPDNVNDTEVESMIRWVWNRYGHLSGLALSEMAHEPGTAWHRCVTEAKLRVMPDTLIPDEYILSEFLFRMNPTNVAAAVA